MFARQRTRTQGLKQQSVKDQEGSLAGGETTVIKLQNQGLAEEPKKAIYESANELSASPFEHEIQKTFQPAQNSSSSMQ